MAVNTKTKEVPAPVAVSASAEPRYMKLELARINRYVRGTQLYEKGAVYEFTEDGARTMLQLRDPLGLPVFTLARPKTRVVEVPVDQPVKRVERVERIVTDLENFASLNRMADPAPTKIELGDADDDVAQRLAALDGQPGETDSAHGDVTI